MQKCCNCLVYSPRSFQSVRVRENVRTRRTHVKLAEKKHGSEPKGRVDLVWQAGTKGKVVRGKDRDKVRGVLSTRESASGIQAYFSTLLLCLSSCASNFISTSIFSNLLLVSQGDTIQALTRISPQIDWYCNAQGTLGKKACLYPPPFTSHSFLSNPSLSALPLRLVFPWCLLVSHLSWQHHPCLPSW